MDKNVRSVAHWILRSFSLFQSQIKSLNNPQLRARAFSHLELTRQQYLTFLLQFSMVITEKEHDKSNKKCIHGQQTFLFLVLFIFYFYIHSFLFLYILCLN
jgi:DNA-binding transcriptional regulator PaaX